MSFGWVLVSPTSLKDIGVVSSSEVPGTFSRVCSDATSGSVIRVEAAGRGRAVEIATTEDGVMIVSFSLLESSGT